MEYIQTEYQSRIWDVNRWDEDIWTTEENMKYQPNVEGFRTGSEN
jgi:hypothetical protein